MTPVTKAWTWGPISRAFCSSRARVSSTPARWCVRGWCSLSVVARPGLASEMAGDLPAPVEDIDHRSAQAYIDLLADILVGHRVKVPLTAIW